MSASNAFLVTATIRKRLFKVGFYFADFPRKRKVRKSNATNESVFLWPRITTSNAKENFKDGVGIEMEWKRVFPQMELLGKLFTKTKPKRSNGFFLLYDDDEDDDDVVVTRAIIIKIVMIMIIILREKYAYNSKKKTQKQRKENIYTVKCQLVASYAYLFLGASNLPDVTRSR